MQRTLTEVRRLMVFIEAPSPAQQSKPFINNWPAQVLLCFQALARNFIYRNTSCFLNTFSVFILSMSF